MSDAAISELKFQPVLELSAFPELGHVSLEVNGWSVLIHRAGDSFSALIDRCSHAASPLSTGRFRGNVVMCPLHGARFNLTSGECIGGAHGSLRTFPVRVVAGWVELAVPSVPPVLNEQPVRPA